MDVSTLSTIELLRGYGAILDELRRRDIVRSANSPISDLAEVLFCRAFGWLRQGNSAAGYDATDSGGTRFQIKARRMTGAPGERQLSAIRNIDRNPFDQLAAVLFDPGFAVHRAALIPISVVRSRARRSIHTNSHIFYLRDDVWSEPGVLDVTVDIREAADL
ncbi:MAG: hypothetical protein H6876_00945 [Hyphomicrobiaceae bacterium]|nr:hypothetical protein [Hyphomicrobiaceae bacterium]